MQHKVDIPVASLQVDLRNARLRDEKPSQQTAMLSIIQLNVNHFLNIASSIADKGLDPLTVMAVVASGDDRKLYHVLEGNRRLTALRALETPAVAAPALSNGQMKKLNAAAKRYADNPIESIPCVLFDTEEEAEEWITIRHTGQNEGVGTVAWGSEEKDRYHSRHGTRSAAGQVIEFVEKSGLLSEFASKSRKRIISNVKRLLTSPYVRERLGIDIEGGEVHSWFPRHEVSKGLTRIIEDLKTEKIKVGHIYHKEDRETYADSIPGGQLPDPSTRLSSPRPLDALESPTDSQPPKPKRKPGRTKPQQQRPRTTVIPKDCILNIDPPRINNVYWELQRLNADECPNACSVTLRVFLELSVDHYLHGQKLMSEDKRRNTKLALRMKAVADHLATIGRLNPQQLTAVENIADKSRILAPTMPTFNLYVHNPYVFPIPSDLRFAWDELQTFMEQLWL
jgi:hypothetical protein